MPYRLPRRVALFGALLLGLLLTPAFLRPAPAAAQTGPGNPTLIGPLDGATGQFNPVVLRWNTAPNTLSYDVAYLDSTVSSTYNYSGALTTTSFTLPTMPDGHLIYWEVFACDASSCPGQSPLWSFSMNAPAPGTPSLVAPNNVSGTGTTPTLSWNQPSGVIAGVTVYSATVTDGDTGATMGTTGYTAALSVAVPASFSLVYGRSYTWNVTACNAGACSGWGPSWAPFSTANAPSPPALSSPNNVSGIGATPTLFWSASSDAIAGVTQYYAGVFDGDTGTQMGVTAGTTGTSATVPAGFNLVLGTSYTWNAYACNGWACSGWGASWFPFSTANAPAAPPLLSPNNVNNTGPTPTLSWSQPSGAYAGVTQYSAGVFDGDSGTLMGTTAYTTALSVPVPASFNLVYGKSYTWNVQACNDWPCSGWGPTWDPFTTAPPPDRPAESAPLNYTAAEGTTPTVSWSAPTNSVSGITTYTIGVWLLNWQDGTSSTLPTLSAGTALSQAIPSSEGLVAGLSYFWAVYGCNDWSCGDWSATEWLFSTAPAPSAAQQTAPADGATNTGTTVTLTWNASTQNNNPAPGQTHYYVDVYDQDTGQFVQQNASIGISTSDALPALTSGDVYRWIVTACNGADIEQVCTQTLSTAGPTYTWPEFFTAPVVQAPWPGATISAYISQNDGGRANDLGAAIGGSGIPPSMLALDLGRQTYLAPDGVGNQAGTLLPPTGSISVTLGTVSNLVMNFLQGYVRGGGRIPITVGIGTNNYKGLETVDYNRAGIDWANFVLSVQSAANDPTSGIAGDFIVIGASDMEPDWNTASNTTTWLDTYGNVAGARPLINYGTCDGCDPNWAGQAGCTYQPGRYCNIANISFDSSQGGNHWTVSGVYHIAYGAPIVRSMPEIYGAVYAQEWQYIALYGSANDPRSVPDAHGFVAQGPWTECVAAVGPNNALAYPPSSGYGALWNALNDPHWAGYTGQTPSWSSDIAWDYQFVYNGSHVLQLPPDFSSCVVQNHGFPYHP
ncbi:MAG TPA: hypothetical protein VKV26_10690 [Dehalococcoidia bacterium]|nr:hypothetical protein [Dehalococcoidia bacterium]